MGGMALTGLAQSLQSFIWGVVDWLGTFTSVVYMGGMAFTGLAQSLHSFIWGYGVDWLGTVTSVVYLGGMC